MIKKLIMLLLAVFAVGMAHSQHESRDPSPCFHAGFRRDRGEVGTGTARGDGRPSLDVRLGRGEGLPGNFEGWLRRDYSGPELDPWDRPWFIAPDDRAYTVGSDGAGRRARHRGRHHGSEEPAGPLRSGRGRRRPPSELSALPSRERLGNRSSSLDVAEILTWGVPGCARGGSWLRFTGQPFMVQA